jgi:hypothetical protein
MARWYPKPKRWAGAIVKRTVQLSPDPGLGGLWPRLDCVAISCMKHNFMISNWTGLASHNHCSDMPENENMYTNVRLLHRSAQSEIERKWFLMVLVVVRYLCLCVHPNIPAASRSCTRTTPISEKDRKGSSRGFFCEASLIRNCCCCPWPGVHAHTSNK